MPALTYRQHRPYTSPLSLYCPTLRVFVSQFRTWLSPAAPCAEGNTPIPLRSPAQSLPTAASRTGEAELSFLHHTLGNSTASDGYHEDRESQQTDRATARSLPYKSTQKPASGAGLSSWTLMQPYRVGDNWHRRGSWQ